MSKRRADQRQLDSGPSVWRPRWRIVVSVLLLTHLSAVFIAPFTFATSSGPGSVSPLAAGVMNALRGYIDAAYLNHGYFFFAPNPGPSHLLRFRVEDRAGSTQELMFPDRQRQWPRLLYHRYFMLSESLNSRYVPAQPPPEIVGDAGQLAAWREARRQYELLRASYCEHLCATGDAARADVIRVEHRQPAPLEFQEGLELDSPMLYRDLLDDILAEPAEVLP